MIFHTLKIIFRNQKRNKINLVINLLGITISLASVMIIMAFVISELRVGNEFKGLKNVYRVEWSSAFGHQTNVCMPLAGYLAQNHASVEAASSLQHSVFLDMVGRKIIMKRGDNDYELNEVLFADTSFFTIFPYKVIAGDPNKAMEKVHGMVLTQSEARRIFGDENPIGQQLIYDDRNTYTVEAVIEDVPDGSLNYFRSVVSIQCDILNSIFGNVFRENWGHTIVACILKLYPGTDVEEVRNFTKNTLQERGYFDNPGEYLKLVPYEDIYFSQVGSWIDIFRQGNYKIVVALFTVAVFILVIALINFINLTNAQGLTRAKEIGVRKVNGCRRIRLVYMFMVESVLINLISFIVAVLLVYLVSRNITFHELANAFKVLFTFKFLAFTLVITLIMSVLAGMYPGLHLTVMNVVKALKGEKISLRGKTFSRMGLVSFQFVVAIVLLISIFNINKQMNYVFYRDIGFDKENLVSFSVYGFNDDKEVLRDKLIQHPLIKDISYSSSVPGTFAPGKNYYDVTNDGRTVTQSCGAYYADNYFLNTTGIEIIQGANYFSDRRNCVINETAAREFGIENLDKNPSIGGTPIVGIVKDFNFEPVHNAMSPLGIFYSGGGNFCLVNIASSDPVGINNAIRHIKANWKEIAGNIPLEINFVDDTLQQLYKKETNFRVALNVFTAIAIFVSIIGLFGISLYLITARIKEIGVRKVNGATLSEMLTMLNVSFVKYIIISFIIAGPVAWIIINMWLNNFAYKIPINWWIMPLAGVIALLTAITTVSFHAWKAASRNPVEALRYE